MKTSIINFSLCLIISVLWSCHSSKDEFEDAAGVNKEDNSVFSFLSSKEKLPPQEYMSWVEDSENGLVKSNTIEECVYSVFYKPLPYVVLKDWPDTALTQSAFDKQLDEYKGLQYYSFIIESKNVANGNQELLRYNLKSTDDYFARIEYYSFQVQNDIKLVEGKDTLVCRMSHFERAYGLQPKIKIVVAFDRRKDDLVKKEEHYNNDKVILFYDKVFGAGIVKLKIDKETLKNIPELKIG